MRGQTEPPAAGCIAIMAMTLAVLAILVARALLR